MGIFTTISFFCLIYSINAKELKVGQEKLYEDKCQDWLNLKMGRLISPVGLDQVCKWNISTVEGSYITLEIKSFDVSAVLKACLSLMQASARAGVRAGIRAGARAGSARAGSARAGSARAGSARVGSARAGSARACARADANLASILSFVVYPIT